MTIASTNYCFVFRIMCDLSRLDPADWKYTEIVGRNIDCLALGDMCFHFMLSKLTLGACMP